jgi:hypothetical protein
MSRLKEALGQHQVPDVYRYLLIHNCTVVMCVMKTMVAVDSRNKILMNTQNWLNWSDLRLSVSDWTHKA